MVHSDATDHGLHSVVHIHSGLQGAARQGPVSVHCLAAGRNVRLGFFRGSVAYLLVFHHCKRVRYQKTSIQQRVFAPQQNSFIPVLSQHLSAHRFLFSAPVRHYAEPVLAATALLHAVHRGVLLGHSPGDVQRFRVRRRYPEYGLRFCSIFLLGDAGVLVSGHAPAALCVLAPLQSHGLRRPRV